MKIIQINSVCGTGSTGRIVAQISDYLDKCNVDNYIAYGFGKSNRSNSYRFSNGLDAHLHSFFSRKLGWQGKMSHIATWRLIRYIDHIKPDIVHLHNIHGHYLNYNMLFRFLNKREYEVVWTFHDCWPVTGKCAHFTEARCEKWKIGCYDCPQLDRYPDSERDRSSKSYREKKKAFTAMSKLHIVTVSKWLKTVVEESFLGGVDTRCIYNGVDVNQFVFQSSELRKENNIAEKFVILSVASVWNEGKGLKHFIDLSQRLADDEVIVLIGITPEQQKDLPDNIIGIPPVKDTRVLAQWYSLADVYINLSIEETFGLVVAEAMSCGTPAIVMNSTACPEVVDADTGFVAEPINMETILSYIRTIRDRGRKNYSEKCRERVETQFSVLKMQETYWKLYCELGVKND